MHEQMLCCRAVTCIYIRVSGLCSDLRCRYFLWVQSDTALERLKVVNISRDLQVKMASTVSTISPLKDMKLKSSKLICFKSIQYTEHLKHKQGHLLRATHSTFQIRKLIFSSGALGNVFTQTISYSSASLRCCVSVFALKKSDYWSHSRCCNTA